MNRLSMSKHVVRVHWEHLAWAPVHEIFSFYLQQTFISILKEVWDTKSEWTVFHTLIA